ncbi:MAG: helix-turn-helix transcriptional regulator, partial [Christensenella sp.]
PDYLSHLFRDKANISLTNFITNERIKKAKGLLCENKLSIRDIALTSGFQNISYFSKQFKRATGVTPQDFRKG